MAKSYAGQPVDRVLDALERALVQIAAKGDRAAIEDIQRALHAARVGATEEHQPAQVFRGKKQVAFEALLQGATQGEAAARAKASRITVYRWTCEPEFAEALRRARSERVALAQDGVADLAPLAVRRLRGVLLDPSAAHRDLISAAREVLDRAGVPKRQLLEVSVDGEVALTAADLDTLLGEIEEIKEIEGLRIIDGGVA